MSMPDDLSFTPVGYEPMQAEWWPVLAASIPKPWPREAALMDLRWWRGQELATRALGMRRVATMPGRPALMARWGWGDWPVRSLLRAESEWADPLRGVSSDSPGVLQPGSSDSPAGTRANAGSSRKSASDSPGVLQPGSSDSPHARVDTASSITDPPMQDQHQGDDQPDTRKADPRSDLDTDPTLTDTNEDNPMQLFGKEIPHPADTRIVDPPKAPPVPSWVPKDTKPYARADVAGMVLAIVAEHRRPADLDASAPTPEIAGDVRCKGDAKTVLALWSYLERPPLGEFAADVIAVIRAAQPGGCPHRKFARDIRAENWDGGTDRHRDLDSVLVHARWEMRRAMAREWTEHPERFAAEPVRPIKPPDNRDVLSFFREPRIQ